MPVTIGGGLSFCGRELQPQELDLTLCETVRGPTREAHGRGRRTETTPGRAIHQAATVLRQRVCGSPECRAERPDPHNRSCRSKDPGRTAVWLASWYSLDSLNLDQLV